MLLGIYGAGGLGREALAVAHDINQGANIWSDLIFIDDVKASPVVNKTKVYTFEEAKEHFNNAELVIVIAVGEPAARTMLKKKVESAGFKLATLVHPAAKISENVIIGDGVVICYGCFISCNVQIGSNTYCQPLVAIGHDTIIRENCVISHFVGVAGACEVGEETFIGMNVPVREHVHIGARSIIGMGSVVLRDIPDEVIALGNPARPMKKNENHRVFQ